MSTKITISIAGKTLLDYLRDLQNSARESKAAQTEQAGIAQDLVLRSVQSVLFGSAGTAPQRRADIELAATRIRKELTAVAHTYIPSPYQSFADGTIASLPPVPNLNLRADYFTAVTRLSLWSGNQLANLEYTAEPIELPVGRDSPVTYPVQITSTTTPKNLYRASTNSYIDATGFSQAQINAYLGQGYVIVDYETRTETITAWSCEVELPNRNQLAMPIVLPAGGKNCIVVWLYREAAILESQTARGLYSLLVTVSATLFNPGSSVLSYYTPPPGPDSPLYNIPNTTSGPVTTTRHFKREQKAYLCSPTAVREIPIPAKLQSFIDLISPNNEINTGYLPNASFAATIGPLDSGFKSTVFTDVWGPSVFENINMVCDYLNTSPIITPSLIKSFPASTKPVLLTDIRSGYYKSMFTGEPEPDKSLYYARWLGGDSYDYYNLLLYQSVPSATQLIDPTTPEVPASPTAVWDWDDPNYCRAVCADLGFTPQDLVP